MHGVERSVMSLTVHTYTHTYITRIPGPFQRRKAPEVLKAALQLRTPYVDVCDDIDLSQVAKGYHEEAKRAGVPMLISTGVWPGISSLMAVDVAEALGGPAETDSIDFQFYTAGSGGAGTTILRSGLLSLYWGALKASMGQFDYDSIRGCISPHTPHPRPFTHSATFLILSESVLAFVNGQERRYAPASDFRTVDFGPGVGPRQIFRMNLLEAYSCFRCLGVPNCATSFGTAPDFWNYLLKGMTFLPKALLRDRAAMQVLARVSEPLVRVVDTLVR